MKKSTLAKIVKLIENEKMDSEDVRKVMNAIRKQDEVVGDIVVCSDDIEDVMYADFGGRDISEETENEVRAIVGEEVEGFFDVASERFWDSFIDDIDDTAREVIG